MFFKKILLLVLASATITRGEPTNTHQQLPAATTTGEQINTQQPLDHDTVTLHVSDDGELTAATILDPLEQEEQGTVTLRSGPENKSFSNVRVYNTLHTKDLYVEGTTVIGDNLKVNNNTIINGNLTVDGTISGGGSGNVSGPGSSTPNAVARFSNTTGTAITDSPVLIDNAGNISGINNITMTGNLNGPVNITMAGGDLTGVNNVTMSGDLTGVTNITASGTIAAQDLSSSGTLLISAIANINSPTAVVTWPTTAGAAGTFLGSDGAGNLVFSTPGGGGDVSAAANFTTNNRVVLTDTPSGVKNVKESMSVVIDALDNITGVNNITATQFNGPLNGNATTATSASNIGGKTAAEVATSVNATQAATNAGTPNTLVLRDGVGNGGFSAGAITATQFNGPLNGNATTATSATTAGTATNFSGSLGGDVTGPQGTTVVGSINGGAMTSATIITGVNLANAATDLNTAGRIVRRDGSGSFSAGTITATQFNGPLTGNVTGNVSGSAATATSAVMSDTAQWFTQNLAGDVTGPQLATVVASVGGKTAAQVATSVDDTIAATDSNIAGRIVKRDGSSHFSVNSITIINPPTADSDATNKAYVDSIAQGLLPKAPVLVTSIIQTPTATLATPVDGVTLSANDRVLLTQQTYQIDNGIWLAQSTDWTRPTDFAIGSTAGQAFVLTTSGLTLAGSGWVCTTPLAVVGTDTVTFVQFSSSGNTTGANVGSGVGEIFRDKMGLTLNFKTLAEGNFIDITNGANEITFAVTATSDNTPNTVVSRDATGTFAGSLTGAASLNVLKTGDTMTGNLIMANESQIRWARDTGANFIGFKAPSTGTFAYTVNLPGTAPTAGQFLQALDASSLTWTSLSVPPLGSRTYYVDLTGSDSNNGSLAAPFRTIKYAVSIAKIGTNPFSNPATVSIGAGRFLEDRIDIDVDGLSIIGSSDGGTIVRPNNPTTENLFQITANYVILSDLLLQAPYPITSTFSAIDMATSAYGRSIFNNIGIAFFNTGISLSNSTVAPAPIFMENILFGHNANNITSSNSQLILRNSNFQGARLPSSPAQTGIEITGPLSSAFIFSNYFNYFDTCIKVTNGASANILSNSFKDSINGITCSGGAKCTMTGLNFVLNTTGSVNVSASGSGTDIYVEGCLFDCEDATDTAMGTAITVTGGAHAIIGSSTIEKAEVGIECGVTGDTATTRADLNGVSVIETTTSVRQRGSSAFRFTAGALDTTTLDIADPTNLDFAGFDANGTAHLAIGKTTDIQSDIYEILNGQPVLPHLTYEPNYYGYKGTLYHNPNDNPTFNATQSELNDARYFVVTGKNYKEAGISLISDANALGVGDNVRGWSITKTGTTAELVFTFTNNDPGQANCGPYNVMQLNGFANQVEFPTATGTLPTNLTAKLLWGSDTNLYRSAADTLKTDDNFVVGGTLTAGSTFISTLTLAAGTAANPSLQFAGSTNTGLSAQTANRLSFDTNGVERMSISSTGTVSINEFTIAGVVHNNAAGQLSSSLIVNADIAANAAIVDTKLATISTAGKVLDSATTATSNNVFNTIVKRDTSGNFAASAITLNAGSATSPSLTFTNGTTTGIFAPTDNALAFSTNGVERMSIDSTGTVNILGTLVIAAGTAAAPSLKFTNGTNTGLSSATANRISFDINGVEKMSMDATAVTVTAAAFIVGNLLALDSIQVDATNNTSVTVANSTSTLLKIPSANVATYAITMPSNPINGQLLTIIDGTTAADNFQINGITYVGATVYLQVDQLRPNTNMDFNSNGQSVTYIYHAATTTWYRYGRG